MPTRSSTVRTPTAPLAAAAIGVLTTMVALAALVVAGIAAAGVFPATDAAAALEDRGTWMAIQAWATPLALTGLGVLFGIAIPVALRDVRDAIDRRRQTLVDTLPTLIQGARS